VYVSTRVPLEAIGNVLCMYNCYISMYGKYILCTVYTDTEKLENSDSEN